MADRIHATDATRQLVGEDVIDFLELLPNKPDVIFSRQDFESDNIFGWFADQGRVDNLLRLGGVEDISYDEHGNNHLIVTSILNQAMDSIATTDNNAASVDISEAVKLIDGEYTKSITDDNIDFVTTLNAKSSVNFFATVTEIPEEHFSDLVRNLSFKDLSTYVLFHEVGHVSPVQDNMSRSEKELHSDIAANALYKDAFVKGIVKDPMVPEVFSQVRAMATILGNTGKAYIYNGTIDPDTNINQVTHDGHQSVDSRQIYDAIDNIHRQIAAPAVNDRVRFEALTFSKYEKFVTSEQAAEIQRLRDLFDDAPLEEIEALMAGIKIPPEHQEYYQISLNNEIESLGRNMAKEQPELLYEQTKLSLLRGDYNNSPAVKTLMENFVIGAEKLTPDHFSIEGTPYITHKQAMGEDMTFGLDPVHPPSDSYDSNNDPLGPNGIF